MAPLGKLLANTHCWTDDYSLPCIRAAAVSVNSSDNFILFVSIISICVLMQNHRFAQLPFVHHAHAQMAGTVAAELMPTIAGAGLSAQC